MELKTIRQVSTNYGISRRMLCYYEEIGLLKSSRKDDYAYRVYDEDALKRLQQIVILRKLQIPIKQIKDILNNQDAVKAIEIFKQSISELDEKITALSTVKSILAHFVGELQEKANVHLKFDFALENCFLRNARASALWPLNDKSMISLVDSLSIPISRVDKKVSMDELSKASETLDRFPDNKVRIVYFQPMTMACVVCAKHNPNTGFGWDRNLELIDDPHKRLSITTKTIMKKFIDDINLFNIYPNTRIFSWGLEEQDQNGNWVGDSAMLASIPDDLDVPAPIEKIRFDGGLYAAYTCRSTKDDGFNFILEWLANGNDYEATFEGGENRPPMDEHINPFNRYGLKNAYSEEADYMYVDFLMPIRELDKFTEEAGTALENLEKSAGKPVEIELTSMVQNNFGPNTEWFFEAKHKDGVMIIKAEKDNHYMMTTPQHFNCPLKIELRAKTDDAEIRLKYARGFLIFNPKDMRNTLVTDDITDRKFSHHKSKDIPANEYADIEWIIGKELVTVKVNGELRHFSMKNPDFNLSSPVSVTTAYGSTITVERLCITEL